MITIRNLEAGYGALRVLKSVSLHVGEQEIVTIIGPNGAGKSTLLMAITGIVRPFAGSIEFNGKNICDLSAERRVGMGCVLVPEGRRVFATMSVKENLELGAYVFHKSGKREHIGGDMERIFSLFPILKARQRQLAGTLSGGEQQMLAIGRALMARPAFLMMDEPSMGIAPVITQAIFKTIVKLREEEGMSILLVEQNARRALAVADRGYVIETGQFVIEGTQEELLDNNDVQRAYLGKEYRAINE